VKILGKTEGFRTAALKTHTLKNRRKKLTQFFIFAKPAKNNIHSSISGGESNQSSRGMLFINHYIIHDYIHHTGVYFTKKIV